MFFSRRGNTKNAIPKMPGIPNHKIDIVIVFDVAVVVD